MKAGAWKMEYLAMRQGYRCPVKAAFPDRVGGGGRVAQLHHRMANTIWARKRFPRFLDSLLNLVAVSAEGHAYEDKWAAIREAEAERREDFLRRHPRWCAFVNGEGR